MVKLILKTIVQMITIIVIMWYDYPRKNTNWIFTFDRYS